MLSLPTVHFYTKLLIGDYYSVLGLLFSIRPTVQNLYTDKLVTIL